MATVALGLASFALVLALVEQVGGASLWCVAAHPRCSAPPVPRPAASKPLTPQLLLRPPPLPSCRKVLLEVLTTNVRVGSAVYEQGHTVLLCWCESAGETQQVRGGATEAEEGSAQRLAERPSAGTQAAKQCSRLLFPPLHCEPPLTPQVTRMLKQLCLAYRGEGGRTIAVLTQRGKLDMEAEFARCAGSRDLTACAAAWQRRAPGRRRGASWGWGRRPCNAAGRVAQT